MDTLRNLNRLREGIDKVWILQNGKNTQHLFYDYLQQINFCIQDLNAEYGHINDFTRKEVVYCIALTDWIQEAMKKIEKCIRPDVLRGFVYKEETLLREYEKYLKALRSLAVAHPLSTDRHQSFGFNGDIICVDIHTQTPQLAHTDWYYHFDERGVINEYKSTDNFYLIAYSRNIKDSQFQIAIGGNTKTLIKTAQLYIDKLYALNRYLKQQKKRDFI